MSFYSTYILPRIIEATCGSKPIKRQRQKVLPLCRGTVLEIGCGTGSNFEFYDLKKVEKLIALEPAPEMIKRAEKEAQNIDLDISFLEVGAEKIPLKDKSVDTVLLTYTLCSIPDPYAALAEIKRVLKNGGSLIFCEHGLAPDYGVRLMQNVCNVIWPSISGGCNVNRDVESVIAESGFKIKEIDTMYLPKTPRWLGHNSWGVAAVS
jgi:ubiquinone/menaquinone biosynthesis C-methylase UbiE